MNKSTLLFIGLDTGKVHSEVGYSGSDWEDKPTLHGRIKTTKQAIQKLVRQLQSKYPEATLHFVYEAGPCGYWIYRLLTKMGHSCYVVAPSLIAKKPGAKIKNDKRDALTLCQLLKTGDIDPIYVPEPEDESIRDLSRARERAMSDLSRFDHPRKLMAYVGLVPSQRRQP